MENTQDFVINKGVLNSYRGPSGEVTIPEGVKEIGREAFSGCTGLTSVTIPEGVTKIGESAFEDCTGLTSVTIPKGVKEIGWNAFEGCTGLTSVTIPEGVTEIEEEAFCGCAGLTSVTIPKGVKEIGYRAFEGCTGLTSVTIPEGVTEIGHEAFSGCTGLTSVTIPKSVTKIEKEAFKGCHKLADEQGIVAIRGILFDYTGPSGDVTIPEGVTEIGYRAFYACPGLTSVTIPEGVTEIGESAFSGCTGLTSVTIPEGVKEIGGGIFSGCTGLTSVTIPEGVTVIGETAFRGCTGLTSVTIPKSVTAIRKSIFENSRPAIIAPHIPVGGFDAADKPGACAGFAKLYLDGAALDEEIKAGYLKYIKEQKKRLFPVAIQHEELLQLMLAEKMLARKDIDPLLEECDRQNNIAAKATVLDYAGKSLKPVDPVKEMERELTAMERSAKNMEEFQATGVMKVGEAKKSFRYKKLEEGGLVITGYKGTDTAVVIPRVIGKDQVTKIGDSAFAYCGSLTSVTIPESVKEIGDSVFMNCPRLVIHTPAGSYAERYARKNGIWFQPLEG